MKYFVFGDCHGNFPALIEGLDKAGYDMDNKEHTIIGLGDYFGRCSRDNTDWNVRIFNYLTSPMHANKPILLRGNHENILLNIFDRGDVSDVDCYNGEDATIMGFSDESWVGVRTNRGNCIQKVEQKLKPWIESMPYYCKTDNYLFTHGWAPLNFTSIEEGEWKSYTWCKTPQEVKMEMQTGPRPYTMVVGHWHASDIRERYSGENGDHIYYLPDIKAYFIDCCTARSGVVEILKVED